MKPTEVEISFLWKRNATRSWVEHLERLYENETPGKDFDTIDYWVYEFFYGKTSTLTVDRDYTILDGHHRLIAARRAGINTVFVNICPQKSTYGQ